jgi:hypothetical protein
VSVLVSCARGNAPPRQAEHPAPAQSVDAPDDPPPDDAPKAEPSWCERLPELVLDPPSDAVAQAARACMARHGVMRPDADAAALMAAATCLRDVPAPGREIQIYRHLTASFPDAPEAKLATRELGLRAEQIDQRDLAITAYVAYLRRYPAEPDARALGQRAVCLARSLQDDARTDEIGALLEGLYGGKGFTLPDPEGLEAACTC